MSRLKDAIPQSWRAAVRHIRLSYQRGAGGRMLVRSEFKRDAQRYLRHMAPLDYLAGGSISGRNLLAQVTKDYHRVEKGLSLAKPRRPFGIAVGQRLQWSLKTLDPSTSLAEWGTSALDALTEWNEGGDTGRSIVSPERANEPVPTPEDAFFTGRHSIRMFEDRAVEGATLEKAVEVARSTPSVCNRQSWHVRFYSGEEKRVVLGYQNGNSGFGESVPVVALVTVDLRDFAGHTERYQPWIEGGLFSMTLVWVLHSMGLASCMLNMSVDNATAGGLRQEAGVDDSEVVIMMIAIGYAPSSYRVARSPRIPVGDIVRYLSPSLRTTKQGDGYGK